MQSSQFFLGSRSSSPNRSAGSFSQKPASRPTPTPTSTTASRPTTGGGMFSGLGGMFVSGMALGAGSEIGHQAMRGLMGTGKPLYLDIFSSSLKRPRWTTANTGAIPISI